jgi:hypothetical protein
MHPKYSSVFEATTLFVEVNVRVVKMLMCRGLTFTFLLITNKGTKPLEILVKLNATALYVKIYHTPAISLDYATPSKNIKKSL